jgi:hypothetical protein
VSLVADGNDITLLPGGVRTLLTLFRLRRAWRSVAVPLRPVLDRTNIRLHVRVVWFGRVQLLPDPGLIFRLILPRSGTEAVS